MQHERESLAAPRIRWLGLRTSELAGYAISGPFVLGPGWAWGSSLIPTRLGVPKDVLIPISKHDEKKVCTRACARTFARARRPAYSLDE